LKEVMAACPSFCTAQAVSIMKDDKRDGWILNVHWGPDASEGDCIERITAEHDLEMVRRTGAHFSAYPQNLSNALYESEICILDMRNPRCGKPCS